MDELFKFLKEKHIEPLDIAPSALALKKLDLALDAENLPMLPKGLAHFLKTFNGLSDDETLILGITPDHEQTDLLAFNRKFYSSPDVLILGFDDLSVLIWGAREKKYILLDKESSDVVEDFTEDEIQLALISIVH